MKKVEAIIRRSKFRAVKEALHEKGINFFSYWDVTGIGNESTGQVYRGVSLSKLQLTLLYQQLRQVKLEMVRFSFQIFLKLTVYVQVKKVVKHLTNHFY